MQRAHEPAQSVKVGWRAVSVLGLLLTGSIVTLDALFPEPRMALGDLMIELRGRRELHRSVVLVDFEEWPRRREEIARVVEAVHRGSPRVIALDVLLEDDDDPEGDAALAMAIENAGCVVLPVSLRKDGDRWSVRPLLPAMARAALATGVANFLLDQDGTVRRVPMDTRALASSDAPDTAPEPALPGWAAAVASAFRARGLHESGPPMDPAPSHLIDWSEIAAEELSVASYTQLVSDEEYAEGLTRLGFFADRVAILGHLGGEPHGDEFLTPLSRTGVERVPGVVVHANAVSDLLEGRRLHELPRWLDWAALLAASIVGAGLGRRGLGKRPAGACAALLAGGLGAQLLSLKTLGWVWSAGPAAAGAVAGLLGSALLTAEGLRRIPLVRQVVTMLVLDEAPEVAVLTVLSERSGKQDRLTFQLREDLRPGAHVTVYKTLVLQDSFERLASHLDGVLAKGLSADLEVELEELGLDIRGELFSSGLEEGLRRLGARHLHIELGPEDLTIPWELAMVGGRLLQDRFSSSRSLLSDGCSKRTESPPQRSGRLKALMVANPLPLPLGWEPLPAAEDEVAELEESLAKLGAASGTGIDVEVLRGKAATYDALRERLAQGSVDLLHYSGHCVYQGRTPAETGFLLGHRVLGPVQLEQELDRAALPAVVFANGCGTARAATPGMGASRLCLPAAFLASGVQLYVGTLWPVETTAAARFSACFYRELAHGAAAGAALRRAREAARNRWMTQAAYVMYGDPRFRVSAAAGSGEHTGVER